MIKLNKDGLNVPSVTTESITMGDTEVSSFNQFVSKNENGEIEETLYLKGHIKSTTDRAQQFIDIGYDYDSRTGALMALRGVDYEPKPGAFALIARNATEHSSLDGLPNGNLTWNGDLTFNCPSSTNSVQIGTTKNHTNLVIGLGNGRGGSFQLNDNQYYQNEEAGAFVLNALDKNGNMKSLMGSPSGPLTWGDSNIITSDGGTINGELKVLEGNIKINQHLLVNEGTRNIDIGYPYADKSGAYIAFRSATYSDSQPGHFIVGVTDGTNTRQLEVCSSGTLKWNNNLYFNTTNSTSDVSILSNGNYIKLGTITGGAEVRAYSKNHTNAGWIELRTSDGTNTKFLSLKPNGSFTWNANEVITNFSRSHIYFDPAISTSRDIGYSTSNNSKRGAYLTFKAGGDSTNPGMFLLIARDESSAVGLKGYPNGDLTWNDGYILPVGTIVAYTSSTIPAGWLYCNGGAVSRTTYAKLFSVIGTKYGAGDGSTTFNLPGGQGNFLQGYLSNVPIGSKVSPGLPNITGSASFSYGGTGERPGGFRWGNGALGVSTRAQMSFLRDSGTSLEVYENVTLNASNSNSIYGKSSSVQPPAIMVAYIIKYK